MSENDQIDKEDGSVSSTIESDYENIWNNPDSVTFSQLEAVDSAGDMADDLRTLGVVYHCLLSNIRSNDMVVDKYAAVKTVTGEYTDRIASLMAEYSDENKSLIGKALSFLKEAAFKTEMGKKFHAGDYAYVPDSKKPSTWKLRLTESPGAKPTVAQLGRAAAAFSKGGFRGNRVQLPGGAVGKAKAKIRAAYRALGVKEEDMPDSVKESGMMVWKEGDVYRIVASYTNAYRDDDNVPEIISSDSHRNFVKQVDEGTLPKPVFLHWHLKGTEYAVADWLHFDEDTLTVTAVGHVIPGHEEEAKILESRRDIATSHGMPNKSIVRDEKDNTIILQHVTVEISDLPSWAAANSLSTFEVLKEETMAIPDVKKQYLRDLGFTDEKIEEIEKMNSTIQATAQSQNREHKENEAQVEKVEPEVKQEPAGETKETAPAVTGAITAEQVAAAVAQVLDPLSSAVSALSERIVALEADMKETKENSKKSIELAPTASLAALITQQMTAVGSREALVNKNSTFSKSGPVETPAEEQQYDTPGNPLVGMILSGVLGKKNGKAPAS